MREVDVTIDGGIAVVTIDRPQARNAIGLRTIDELGAALDEVLAGAAAVVVLRGAGDRAFVSGGAAPRGRTPRGVQRLIGSCKRVLSY